jgi:arginyl-tRNA synthetase
MNKLAISKQVLEKFPNFKLGVVIAKGIDNNGVVKLSKLNIPVLHDPKVQAWNEAYRTFGADPAKHKPSIVNLIGLANRGLPTINKIVDIYNHISLKHVIPAGGSDLNKIKGNIYLRIAAKKQPFTALRSKNIEYTKVGEVLYSDEEKVLTRRWNYKESDFAKFTKDTTDAILEFEALPPMTKKELDAVLKDAATLIKKHCKGKVSHFVLDKNKPTLDLDAGKVLSKFETYTEEEKKVVEKPSKKISKLAQAAVDELHKITHLPKSKIINLLESPPDPKMGDLAFPCFMLAKTFSKSPIEVAKFLREKLVVPKGFEKVTHLGPYLNFFYEPANLSEQVLKLALKKDFGRGKKSERIMIEYSNPNPLKGFHVGHMRNTVLGSALCKIMTLAGYHIVPVNYYNDTGSHVSKTLWAYDKWFKQKKDVRNKGEWIGNIYAESVLKLKEHPEYESEILEIQKKIDAKDKYWIGLLDKTKKWSVTEFDRIYDELHASFDYIYYDKEFIATGKKIVKELEKHQLVEYEDGAPILNLEKYDLAKKALLRKDGTALYITKDLSLAQKRFKDYKLDKSIYVVGSEQDFYFKQLFKALDLLGFDKAGQLFHLSYDLVLDENMKKFSSRLGTAPLYSTLADKAKALALKEIKKRNPDMPAAKQKQLKVDIAVGAMIYLMLSKSNNKSIPFDINAALSFEGNTGPYLQYALVRASKILKKSKQKVSEKIDFSLLKSEEEQALIKQISKFPQVVEQAAESYSPHMVANFAYELAQKFSTFYAKQRVIDAPKDEELARLLLVKVFYETLKKSLNLLGIQEVEVM